MDLSQAIDALVERLRKLNQCEETLNTYFCGAMDVLVNVYPTTCQEVRQQVAQRLNGCFVDTEGR